MKIKSIYLIAAAIILSCIFSYFNSFEKVESNLRDSILSQEKAPDMNIKIIEIDDESLKALGQWPWPRSYYADLIDELATGNPAVIGIDLIFSEASSNPKDDAKLSEAIVACGKVVLPVYGDFDQYTKLDQMKATSLVEPIPSLKSHAIPGHINYFPDSSRGMSFGMEGDGYIRKALLYFDYNGRKVYSFDWQIYREYIKNTTGKKVDENIPLLKGNRFNIDFVGKPGTYEAIPFYSVLNGDVPPEYFENAIVLIGPYTVGLAKDSYLTPLDHQVPMYGVEIHANTIQTLLYHSFKQDVPAAVSILILAIAGLLGYYVFGRMKPFKAAITAAMIVAAYDGIAKFLYGKGYILQLFYPAVLLAVTYLIILVYKYIEELLERKRVTDVFGKYVAPQVVDQILAGGNEGIKLGGIRKEITVLFVDIRGFTPLSEKVSPEEVVEILNEYLNLCAESIFKYNGTLDKFIGDATMAIFNAPLDLEDHAYQAIRAAWAMKQGAESLREKLMERHGRSIEFGIGINTGHAVIGNIGASFRMDYTAIGDAVNTAARLESNAKPGQIIIGEAVYERVADRITASSLGEIKVKGKENGVIIYQIDDIMPGQNG